MYGKRGTRSIENIKGWHLLRHLLGVGNGLTLAISIKLPPVCRCRLTKQSPIADSRGILMEWTLNAVAHHFASNRHVSTHMWAVCIQYLCEPECWLMH